MVSKDLNVNMHTNSQPLIYFEDVHKRYGSNVVLDNIDMSVSKGEFCTLVGPSGCGKSTLLRLAIGQETPTHGRVLLENVPIQRPSTDRGIVYQKYSLFPHMSVIDNVILGFMLQCSLLERRKEKAKFIEHGMTYLKRLRLDQHATKYPHELSGGMQQRAAIAQALILKPRVLIMDEPFGALDPDTREDVQLFLLELWDAENMTIFFVTHDLIEALYLGSRLFVLSQFYTDDRGPDSRRGSKIVTDLHLGRGIKSPAIKHSEELQDKIRQIKQEGMNPEFLQHAKRFSLEHADSFQTLTDAEHKSE